jgi:hypothetical protein
VDHPSELVAIFLDFFSWRLMMEPKSSEVELVYWRYGYEYWPQLKEHPYAEVHKILTGTSDE